MIERTAMRAGVRAVGCSLAFLVFSPAVRAQCPVFDQTIFVPDKNSVTWATAADVDFVKGPLSHVSTYATMGRGSLTQAISLDISGDNPAPGNGVYYLVTHAEPACASWQTSPGAEPARDTEIYESCNVVNPTEAQIQAAVEAAMVGLVDPWTDADTDEFVIWWDRIHQNLQCVTDLPPEPAASSSAASQESLSGCESTYCPGVGYCGPSNNSEGFTGAVKAGSCLNQACFDHDKCYIDTCISEDPECYFTQQSIGTGCEAPFNSACSSCRASSNAWILDTIICFMTDVLYSRPFIPPICATPPCEGLDTDTNCTRDACSRTDPNANAQTGCVPDFSYEPAGIVGNCDDQRACSTTDACNSSAVCVGGGLDHLRCLDNASTDTDADCTRDWCEPTNPGADPITGCRIDVAIEPSGIVGNCDDGGSCTTADSCLTSDCLGGVRNHLACTDNASTDSDEDCKRDSCAPLNPAAEPGTGCIPDYTFEPNGIIGNCDDDATCTTQDSCSTGICYGSKPTRSNICHDLASDWDADCVYDVECVPTNPSADPVTGCLTASFWELDGAPCLEPGGLCGSHPAGCCCTHDGLGGMYCVNNNYVECPKQWPQ